MRIALIQLCASDDPAANLPNTRAFIEEAAAEGAGFVLTPEVTNCVSADRAHQKNALQSEADDITLSALAEDAARLVLWLNIGSLALACPDGDGRFVNRSFLISPKGEIVARYDKLHMFDVSLSDEETYRESAGYRPGDRAIVADAGGAKVGMTVCYDLRFPHLYRDLAKAGAQVLTVPSAFAVDTGRAHWETLLRARAIETGSFVLAAAQSGTHEAQRGRTRRTYGHSLAVDPWGRVLADGGTDPGVTLVDLNLDEVEDARRRIPSLTHDRAYSLEP